MAKRHFGAPLALLLLEAAAVKDFVVQRPQRMGERAFDAARADRIHENTVRREIIGQRLHEGMLRGIDDGRSNAIRLRYLAGLADDNDEAAAAARFHHRHDPARQFPCAEHLGLEVALERVAGDLVEAARQMRARVADHDIDAAEGLVDVVDERGDIARLADIGDEAFCIR